MRYVSIDLETTGLDPSYCQILEICLIEDDLVSMKPLNQLRKLHLGIRHPILKGEAIAFAMNIDLIERMDKGTAYCEVIDPEWLEQRVKNWVGESRANAAGKNLG